MKIYLIFSDTKDTINHNEETCLEAFEMKAVRKILRVSWTAKKKMSGFSTKLE